MRHSKDALDMTHLFHLSDTRSLMFLVLSVAQNLKIYSQLMFCSVLYGTFKKCAIKQ